MEQNGKKFGVLMAALAVIASVLVMPNVSAGADDLSVTVDGDVFYGAQYGFANLTGSVSSTSVEAADDLISSNNFGFVVDSFEQLNNALIILINSKFEIRSKDFLFKTFDPKTISKKLINFLK